MPTETPFGSAGFNNFICEPFTSELRFPNLSGDRGHITGRRCAELEREAEALEQYIQYGR